MSHQSEAVIGVAFSEVAGIDSCYNARLEGTRIKDLSATGYNINDI